MHTHADAHIKIELIVRLLSGSGMKVKVALKLELKRFVCVYVCVCVCVYMGVRVPICTRSLCVAYRLLETTWALIALAVSSPQHVVNSAQTECNELFTSAAF